ncbi:hypothetical protein F5X98DRAFT_126439 [Xylaria grammica]|nr:hypothetical protein F5X98DRAFT_126439 [Xylaria grammica]
MWAYTRCLPVPKQPSPGIVIKTIQRLAETAYLLLVSKTRKLRYPDYVCDVKKYEVSCAFIRVLSRKQSNYAETLGWLKAENVKLSLLKDIRRSRVQAFV